MKKTVVIFAALLFALGLNAQDVRFGIKAGFNLSQFSETTFKEEGYQDGKNDASKMLPGFHVGGLINFSFGEFFGLQPELLFSTQGGKFEDEVFGDTKVKYNYINLPVLFEVRPFTNFSIMVGPQVGLNVYRAFSEGGITIKGSAVNDLFKEEFGVKSNTLDFAAVCGLQYLVNGNCLISARYNAGFQPVWVSDMSGYKITGMSNRVIQFSLGWVF